MNKTNLMSRGFTLIELLVVIAIIGILAAVVIGSLNDARSGGQNASIQQTMTNVRSQAELYYNGPGNFTYQNLCSNGTSTKDGVRAALNVVNASSSWTTTIPNHPATNDPANANSRGAGCFSNANAYAIVVPLADGINFWCIDSLGNSRRISNNPQMAAGATACPAS